MSHRILGALIGLARATDGNEHLINDHATFLIVDALLGTDTELSLLWKIGEEKARMVPNCMSCANPCGRTSDYDVSRLQSEDPAVQQAKMRILSALKTMAAGFSGRHDKLLYKGLSLIGIEGLTAEYLTSVAEEIEAAAN